MEAMRELLRGSLGRSLRDLRDEDRLAAAWTVACGPAMAERGAVVGYEGGMVRVVVTDAPWMKQMISLRGELARELSRIAGLPISGIHFELKKAASQRVGESANSEGQRR
jgi:hypothetical protein